MKENSYLFKILFSSNRQQHSLIYFIRTAYQLAHFMAQLSNYYFLMHSSKQINKIC